MAELVPYAALGIEEVVLMPGGHDPVGAVEDLAATAERLRGLGA